MKVEYQLFADKNDKPTYKIVNFSLRNNYLVPLTYLNSLLETPSSKYSKYNLIRSHCRGANRPLPMWNDFEKEALLWIDNNNVFHIISTGEQLCMFINLSDIEDNT
jgi:hypothetical protein